MQSNKEQMDNQKLRERNNMLETQLTNLCSELKALKGEEAKQQKVLKQLHNSNCNLFAENVCLEEEADRLKAMLPRLSIVNSKQHVKNVHLTKERDYLAKKWQRVNYAAGEAMKEEADQAVQVQLALEKTFCKEKWTGSSDRNAAEFRLLVCSIGNSDQLLKDVENTTKLVDTKNAEIAQLLFDLSFLRMELNNMLVRQQTKSQPSSKTSARCQRRTNSSMPRTIAAERETKTSSHTSAKPFTTGTPANKQTLGIGYWPRRWRKTFNKVSKASPTGSNKYWQTAAALQGPGTVKRVEGIFI